MHRILLVDDEPLFLKRLTNILDWEACGCTICGEAHDGVEALEKMKALTPDIVILDIGIPYIDGLKICEIVQDWPNKPHIIISTAHDTFDFAHRALKLGVSDYLLKPFDEKDIRNSLKKCSVQIRQDTETKLLHKKVSEDDTARYYRYLLSHGDSSAVPEIHEISAVSAWSVTIIMHHFNISVLEAEERVQSFISTFADFQALIAGTLSDAIIVVNLMQKEMPLLGLMQHYESYGSHIVCDCKDTLAFGEIVYAVENLKQSLATAVKGMENRIHIRKRMISCDDTKNLPERRPAYIPEDMNLLIRCFEEHDYEKADSIIARIFGIEEGHALSFQYVSAVCFSLTGVINAHFSNGRKAVEDSAQSNVNLLRELNICETQEEVLDIIKNFIHELFSDHVSFHKTGRTEQLVGKIRNYIEQHLAETSLSASQISDSLFFENSYIRRVYKAHTGKTVNQEIEDARIRVAMQLLKEGKQKHNEIAKQVGYSNPFYFSRRFKLATNMSPSEYQSICLLNQ